MDLSTHEMMVDKVVKALAPSGRTLDDLSKDQMNEDLDNPKDLDDMIGSEDAMILEKYEKDVKVEVRNSMKLLRAQRWVDQTNRAKDPVKSVPSLSFFPLIIFSTMQSIKVFYWNCRGATHSNKIGRIKNYMAEKRPHFFCLVETRIDPARTLILCRKFAKNWDCVAIPAIGMSGGIVVFWNKHIGKITCVSISQSSLHLIITSGTFDHWVLSIVYNPIHCSFKKKTKKALVSFIWFRFS